MAAKVPTFDRITSPPSFGKPDRAVDGTYEEFLAKFHIFTQLNVKSL